MREALREKGIELPYQDPSLKYQPDEFSSSANMYIKNYADVRNPSLTRFYTQLMGLHFILLYSSLSLPPTNAIPRPPTMAPSVLEHPPSPSKCSLTPALPTCGWTPSTVALRPAVSINQQAYMNKSLICHTLQHIFSIHKADIGHHGI